MLLQPKLQQQIMHGISRRSRPEGNSYQFCEIFNNAYFEKHLWTTASAILNTALQQTTLQNPSPNIAKQQQQEEEI